MKRYNKNNKDKILMPKKSVSRMHPTAEQRKDIKNIAKEEFTRYVRTCGGSGHIGVSRHWVNKKVKVIMEEVLE